MMVSPIVPIYDYATDRYLILGAWVDNYTLQANPRQWRWLVVMHLWAAFPWLWAAPGEGETR